MQNNDCNTKHDCSRIITQINLALDDALNQEEQEALMAEINRCSYCLDQYNIEKSFKEFLCNKINHRCIPNGLVDNIKAKIRQMAVN
jgi:anti-sigma factor (TIGR02949 family)